MTVSYLIIYDFVPFSNKIGQKEICFIFGYFSFTLATKNIFSRLVIKL